ncbi:hypothetical protein SCALM49S_04131 [Streptomyces californicus]
MTQHDSWRAWLGAWAWRDVEPGLRAAGTGSTRAPSGLAEKQGVAAGQRTHVQDVVDVVERLDLRDVVLVGHSYAGIPVGQAAQRIGDRLARVVFVDSMSRPTADSVPGRRTAGRLLEKSRTPVRSVSDGEPARHRMMSTLQSLPNSCVAYRSAERPVPAVASEAAGGRASDDARRRGPAPGRPAATDPAAVPRRAVRAPAWRALPAGRRPGGKPSRPR